MCIILMWTSDLFIRFFHSLFFQEIDGQALLLLNLPTVQECMDLKLGPAIKLCHHIERVKLAFYQQFASWEQQDETAWGEQDLVFFLIVCSLSFVLHRNKLLKGNLWCEKSVVFVTKLCSDWTYIVGDFTRFISRVNNRSWKCFHKAQAGFLFLKPLIMERTTMQES